jgi:hypothetical protein
VGTAEATLCLIGPLSPWRSAPLFPDSGVSRRVFGAPKSALAAPRGPIREFPVGNFAGNLSLPTGPAVNFFSKVPRGFPASSRSRIDRLPTAADVP